MIDKQERRNRVADEAIAEREKLKKKIETDVQADIDTKRKQVQDFLEQIDARAEDRVESAQERRDAIAKMAALERETLKSKIELEREEEEGGVNSFGQPKNHSSFITSVS